MVFAKLPTVYGMVFAVYRMFVLIAKERYQCRFVRKINPGLGAVWYTHFSWVDSKNE